MMSWFGIRSTRSDVWFHALMIEQDLFRTMRLVRNWGRIGTNGQELVEVFATDSEAGASLEALAQAKRRRGYRDL